MRYPAILLATLTLAPAAGAATLQWSSGTPQASRGVVTDRQKDLEITFDLNTLGDCAQPFGINIVGDNSRRGDIRLAPGEILDVRLTPDSDNNAAAATGNQSCYLSVGKGFDPRTNQVEPDAFLPIIIDPNLYFSYLGFYWGSPDPYNEITFWDAEVGGNRITIDGFGDEVTGDELTTVLGRPAYASTYVHFDFGLSEVVRRVELRSIGRTAFEADNLAIKVDPSKNVIANLTAAEVPAPAGLALFGAGVALLGMGRRRC